MKLLPPPSPQKLLTSGEPRYHMGVDYASGRDQTMEMYVTYYGLNTAHPREVRRIGKQIVYDGPAQVVFMKSFDVPWRYVR